jgi:threonine dehydrogenase-like Zn-dependent dehydrogenase
LKALQFVGHHKLELRDVPDPQNEPDHVIIAPEAVGICGTDVHIVEGDYLSTPPVTLGHEVSGKVVEIGGGVTSLKVGDMVTVEPHKYCGVCLYCQIGYEHMCVKKEAYGVHLNGGMAQFQKIPAKIAYKLPEGMPASIGALTEPLACVVHSMDRLQPLSGLPILIIGSGPAGSLLVALSKLSGLNPIVTIDGRKDRQALAKSMGADFTFDSMEQAATAIQELTQGYGFPFLVDAVGNPAILESLVRVASRRATILVFGVASPAAEWTVKPNEIYAKELTIVGSAINPFTHRRALSLLEKLPLNAFQISEYAMSDYEQAFKDHKDGKYHKIQFNPQK